MSRIDPILARRLDRLARGAHAFHRWSHHPLCDAYAPEVVRLGRRTRVCRGCALALAGLVTGAAAGVAISRGFPLGVVAGVLAVIVLWPFPPLPAGARPLPPGDSGAARASARRRGKRVTRFAPSLALAMLAGWGAGRGGPSGFGLAALALATALLALRAYRRRGPDRRACAACPERDQLPTCSGYAPLRRREAAFGRAAGRLIARGAGAREDPRGRGRGAA